MIKKLFLFVFAFTVVLSQDNHIELRDFIINEYDGYVNKNQFGRWQNFWYDRLDSNGNYPSIIELFEKYNEEYKREYNQRFKNLSGNNWVPLGPVQVPENSIPRVSSIGRVNCIEFHPTDSNTIFVGAAAGGLWKTTDKGNTWRIIPMTNFMSIGIGDIAISKSNPNIMYAATGDAASVWLFGSHTVGLIKSIDGGETWDLTTKEYFIEDALWMPKVELNPNNENEIYVCTNKGIMKSENAGKDWRYIIEGYSFRDFKFKPDDPTTFFATTVMPIYNQVGSVYIIKFTNSGENHEILKEFPNALRIKLALTDLDPDRIYAISVSGFRGTTDQFIYTTDGGATWNNYEFMINEEGEIVDFISYQGDANLVLEINPKDINDIFVGGVDLFRTRNNGKTWDVVTMDSVNFVTTIHVDFHDIKFSPHTNKVYAACDGGFYRMIDDGVYWDNLSNGLNITQFYKFAIDPINPDVLYAGSQDNGLIKRINGKWYHFGIGDGMETIVNPKNPNSIYTSTQRSWVYRSYDGGITLSEYADFIGIGDFRPWIVEYDMHPKDTAIVAFGIQNIWLTRDGLDTAYRTTPLNAKSLVRSVKFSPFEDSTIFVGNIEYLYKSTDMGKTWIHFQKVRYSVTDIEFRSDMPKALYYSHGSYDSENKVFFFDGDKFVNLTYDLPNVPVKTIVFNEKDKSLIAGTDAGIWILRDGTKTWERLGEGMPFLVINELEISYQNGKLYAATFGGGLWEYQLFDCTGDYNININETGIKTICEDSSFELFITGDEVNPENVFWSNGEKGSSIIVDKQGDYYASYIDETGCAYSSDVLRVLTNSKPQLLLLLLSNNPVCEGNSVRVRLNVENLNGRNFTINWSNGKSGTLNQTFTQSGAYFATLETSDGCVIYSDTIVVEIYPTPEKPVIERIGNFLKTDAEGSYLWFRNGVALEGETGNSLFIADTGTYHLHLRSKDFCMAISDVYNVNINSLVTNMNVNIFPNPFDKIVKFEYYSETGDFDIELFDILGRKIFENKIRNHQKYFYREYDLTNYSSNVYFLRINENGVVKQFIITKTN